MTMTNWLVLILGAPLLVAWLVQVSGYVLGFSLISIWRKKRAARPAADADARRTFSKTRNRAA
jgi:hypothetical protein